MLADFIRRIECAFRDEATLPFIMMGLLVFGAIGVAFGHGRAWQPFSRRIFALLGMAIGVVLGALFASLVYDVCGPWRQ